MGSTRLKWDEELKNKDEGSSLKLNSLLIVDICFVHKPINLRRALRNE